MFLRDRARFAAVIDACGVLPLGAGALAGVNFATDRDARRGRAGFDERRAELDRRRLQPRLRARLPGRGGDGRDAPLAARRRARAVEQRGVRLLRAQRRAGARAPRSCRRRRTPTPPSCCGRRRRAIVAPPRGAARRDARPAADLQQGHAGGQGAPLRHRRHARAVARRGARDARDGRLPPRAARGGGRRRADRRGRRRRPAGASGVPFREAHGTVAGLVRVAVADGRALSSFSDAELAALAPALDPQALRALLRRAFAGSSRRSRSAARRWRGCASSSPPPGRRSRTGERRSTRATSWRSRGR